jgi:hypothetical protein
MSANAAAVTLGRSRESHPLTNYTDLGERLPGVAACCSAQRSNKARMPPLAACLLESNVLFYSMIIHTRTAMSRHWQLAHNTAYMTGPTLEYNVSPW